MPERDLKKEYVDALMTTAKVETLNNGTYFASLECNISGVWAGGKTEDECLSTLREVLEDFVDVKLREGDADMLPLKWAMELDQRVRELEKAINRFFDAFETGAPLRITQEAIDEMRRVVGRG